MRVSKRLKAINALIDKFLSRLEARTVDHDRKYFYDAIVAFAGSNDPTIAMAALAAAKKARREPRAEYVEFINAIAADEDEQTQALLNQLAVAINAKDWTIRDAIAEGLLLSEIDEEFARALDKHDSHVFRRRFPELFPKT